MVANKELEKTTPAFANAANGPWELTIRAVTIHGDTPAWRVQCESPNSEREVVIMTYPKYFDALKTFNKVKDGIDTSVTEKTERKIICSYCKKELSWDGAFPQLMPHKPNDFAYCGCHGWD